MGRRETRKKDGKKEKGTECGGEKKENLCVWALDLRGMMGGDASTHFLWGRGLNGHLWLIVVALKRGGEKKCPNIYGKGRGDGQRNDTLATSANSV